MKSLLLLPLLLGSLVFAADETARPLHVLPEPGALVPARFSPAPPPGVHPRILISPEDLPGVRERLKTTAAGRRAFGSIQAWLGGAVGPKKPLREAYLKLVAGDPNALDAITAENKWWRDQLGLTVSFEAFVSLIKEDADRGAKAGKALVTFAQISRGKNLADNLAHQFDKSIGYAYDFVYPYLSEEDRKLVRGLIAAATRGQTSHGMGMPAAMHTYNFMPHGMGLLLLALAIEGEEGYDPDIYPKSVAVMRAFLTHGIDAQGDPQEDMHYFNFGMAPGSQALVAMVRRGDNLFGSPNYRKVTNWYAHEMEPFGQVFSMHGDSPNDNGGLVPNYAIMKWVWPEDPVLDLVWRNRAHLDYSGINNRIDLLAIALFPSDWKGTGGEVAKAEADQWGANSGRPVKVLDRQVEALAGADKLGLPLSWLSEKRQHFIARSRWTWDATTLDFTLNHHQRGPSHTHSNSLDITFSALGRKWAIDRGFGIAESKDHSVVLIDGKGQGFFPTAGSLVAHRDDGDLAWISGDAKYAYDWAYEFGNRIGNDYRQGFSWQPETAYPDRLEIERERAAPEFKERPWTDPRLKGYTHKAPYNGVQKAFRTAALKRGDRPYLLVVDDIRKDDAVHTYDWLLQVADDLEIKTETAGEVVLGSREAGDNRRLLVRMVQVRAEDAGAWTLETYEIARSPETGSTKVYGQGRRLRFTCRAVEPGFKVLLLPHREGDALPATRIEDKPGRALQVSWPDRTDAYPLSSSPDGRTLLETARLN